MAQIKFRVRFNEGRKGVPLERLERIATDVRKFLESISEDLDLPSYTEWIGSEFQNRSLSWLNQSSVEVNESQFVHFNNAVTLLAKGKRPPTFIRTETASKFYDIASPSEKGDRVKVGVQPNGRTHWTPIPETRPPLDVSGRISYIGAVQGILHSWFKESRRPYFYIRELSSTSLIKCFYSESVYDELAIAIQTRRNVIHAHGKVVAERETKSTVEIDVDRIFTVKPLTMGDVDEFFTTGKLQ